LKLEKKVKLEIMLRKMLSKGFFLHMDSD
jgi:hypothetical protein